MGIAIGLGSVISHLHRHLGIDRESHPALLDAAIDAKERLNEHFFLEGLHVIYDTYLGVISAVTLDEELIAQRCEKMGVEPFRPMYLPRQEDYWSSVLIVILRRRYEGSETNPAGAWMHVDDLFAEFETYIPHYERENSAKSRSKMQTKLEHLTKSGLIDMLPRHGAEHYAATRWLVLRLNNDVLEGMSRQMDAYQAAIERDGEVPGTVEERGTHRSRDSGDLNYELFQSAEMIPVGSDAAAEERVG